MCLSNAPPRSRPLQGASLRSTSLRSTSLRSVSLRSAPLRSAPIRSARRCGSSAYWRSPGGSLGPMGRAGGSRRGGARIRRRLPLLRRWMVRTQARRASTSRALDRASSGACRASATSAPWRWRTRAGSRGRPRCSEISTHSPGSDRSPRDGSPTGCAKPVWALVWAPASTLDLKLDSGLDATLELRRVRGTRPLSRPGARRRQPRRPRYNPLRRTALRRAALALSRRWARTRPTPTPTLAPTLAEPSQSVRAPRRRRARRTAARGPRHADRVARRKAPRSSHAARPTKTKPRGSNHEDRTTRRTAPGSSHAARASAVRRPDRATPSGPSRLSRAERGAPASRSVLQLQSNPSLRPLDAPTAVAPSFGCAGPSSLGRRRPLAGAC